MDDWERDELVANMMNVLGQCERHTQERMIWHFFLIDDDYATRVGEGLGIKAADGAHLHTLPNRTLTEEDQRRLEKLGNSPPRKLTGQKITGSVPTKRDSTI